jgi:hypothetical protein
MDFPEFEMFLRVDSASYLDAEQRLIERGKGALPDLEAFFSGKARNEFDIPYRRLGKAMRCALETVRRLGPIAKPLEPYLRSELEVGDSTAAAALGSLGSLDEESITLLAACLGGKNLDLSYESAAALIKCGQGHHPAVAASRANSDKAEKTFSRVKDYIDKAAKGLSD